MSKVDHTHARSSGKQRVAASIVWELHTGGLRLRCIKTPSGSFEVQALDKTWRKMCRGDDAQKLLQAIVLLPAIATAVKESQARELRGRADD